MARGRLDHYASLTLLSIFSGLEIVFSDNFHVNIRCSLVVLIFNATSGLRVIFTKR